jgi:hypothetical protein
MFPKEESIMRRAMFVFGLALALGVAAQPAQAQFKFGVHANYVAGGFGDFEGVTALEDFDFSGDFGIGGRLAFSPPLFPLGVFGDLTYYFPDCGASDCSYWNAQVGAQLGLPLPMIRPYLLGGWQFKNVSVDNSSGDSNNPFIGAGVEFGMLAGLFIEGQMEFDEKTGVNDIGATPFVIRAGIQFGG